LLLIATIDATAIQKQGIPKSPLLVTSTAFVFWEILRKPCPMGKANNCPKDQKNGSINMAFLDKKTKNISLVTIPHIVYGNNLRVWLMLHKK